MATSANNSVDVPSMTLRSGKTVYENDDCAHVTEPVLTPNPRAYSNEGMIPVSQDSLITSSSMPSTPRIVYGPSHESASLDVTHDNLPPSSPITNMTRVPHFVSPGIPPDPSGDVVSPNQATQNTDVPTSATNRPPCNNTKQLPNGMPPELWLEYVRIQADKEIQLRTLQLKEKELEHNMAVFGPKTPKDNKIPEGKFRKLLDNEDIDTYLCAFEHLAHSNKWPKESWCQRLAPELTGKAFEVYANLSLDEATDYETLKKAILLKYEVNAETYRAKFRNRERKTGETIREMVHDLNQSFQNWVKYSDINKDDAQGISQLMIIDQAMQTLPKDLAIHLRDKGVKNSNEMAKVADEYIANRGGSEYWKKKEAIKQKFRINKSKDWPPKQKSTNDKSSPGDAPVVQKLAGTRSPPRQHNRTTQDGEIVCYACNKKGHIARDCPEKKVTVKESTGANPKPAFKCANNIAQDREQEIEARRKKCEIVGLVNGTPVSIHRDSQCTQTAVSADLVPTHRYLNETVSLRGITGPVSLPLAEIEIQCPLVSGTVKVAVAPGLHREVILGHDLDKTCGDLFDNRPTKEICVLTRQQAKQQRDKRRLAEAELIRLRDEVRPKEILSDSEQSESQNQETLVDKKQTSKQNRPTMTTGNTFNNLDGKLHQAPSNQERPNNENTWPDKDTLSTMQYADPTLTGVQQRVVPSQDLNKYRVCFYEENGIIMRKWQKRKHKKHDTTNVEPIHQVIIPQKYRPNILNLAHNITMAGHLGVAKTKSRILAHFYWPGIFQDVANYCRNCSTCQYMNKGHEKMKAPLIPMPIISTPFERVGIDIVGPMNRSRKGNRYLLTICDYATRYPEAIPLSNIRTSTVANALLTVFARVGLPEEIVHDQGTNFMSAVMQTICTKLQITQLKATAYHQQTNGITERFHATLKNMMRSLTPEDRNTWDEFIPHFLFAYREVPSQVTGFAPFELLYGRQVRGPLSVIKSNWVDRDHEETDVVTHLLQMRKRIDSFMQQANSTLADNQEKMKAHYDKGAVQRIFEPGDQVLVFLPDSAAKLDSKWQGPYSIVRKINEVNYVVNMADKRKKHRVFHINMLKEWYNRKEDTEMARCFCLVGDIDYLSSQYANAQTQHIEQSDQVYTDMEPESQPITVQNMENMIPNCKQSQDWHDIPIHDLSHDKQQDVQVVFHKRASAITDVPGRTHLVSHIIEKTTDKPVPQKIYRTPQALRDKIKKELDAMLELGIIERANSPYASPITIVRKPGSDDIRICSDMRALNKVCVFDPYEMPRIDDILDQVAGAPFISTLDLTKGFYQVPLDPKSRPHTAFVTCFGQFQYTVLPFGLQNSSSTFMRLMHEVLRGCETFAQAYIDDICIFSHSWDDHIKHLDTVLERIQNAGLTVKPKKCSVGRSQVEYLGHVIGSGTIQPKDDKIQAVKEFPRPLTKKNVRAFLGLSGYYRRFISRYADIALPLTSLTKKALPNTVCWTQECEGAFDLLTSAPILIAPDFTKPFILQADASNIGLGAVLGQLDVDGHERPIVYLSR